MKTIKIFSTVNDIRILYKKANTPTQRALLGYMTKTGVATDPVFGGAFNLLRSIEWCMEWNVIYRLLPMEDTDTTKKIIHVAQMALNGDFDSFSIKVREIDYIARCMSNF